jgi:hypothetical protein
VKNLFFVSISKATTKRAGSGSVIQCTDLRIQILLKMSRIRSTVFNIDGVSGISAAFLVWDAIDLGFTISDLVRRQGSKAGKILR